MVADDHCWVPVGQFPDVRNAIHYPSIDATFSVQLNRFLGVHFFETPHLASGMNLHHRENDHNQPLSGECSDVKHERLLESR